MTSKTIGMMCGLMKQNIDRRAQICPGLPYLIIIIFLFILFYILACRLETNVTVLGLHTYARSTHARRRHVEPMPPPIKFQLNLYSFIGWQSGSDPTAHHELLHYDLHCLHYPCTTLNHYMEILCFMQSLLD